MFLTFAFICVHQLILYIFYRQYVGSNNCFLFVVIQSPLKKYTNNYLNKKTNEFDVLSNTSTIDIWKSHKQICHVNNN